MRTVFITGADRGIGQALCGAFLAEKWQVLAGQYMPQWPELASLQARYPDALHRVALDVADTQCVVAAAQASAHILQGAPLDMLINCAGVPSWGMHRRRWGRC